MMRKTVCGLAIGVALGGCAKIAAPVTPPPLTYTPRPRPPVGTLPGLIVPLPGPDGRYTTVNSGIGAQEALWHVRGALNVAALACRGDAALLKNYNAFLAAKKTALAAAYKDESARLGAAALDPHSTRLYNFFAQPPAQAAFCRAASAELTQIAAVAPASLPTFAQGSIARLEAPFTDFYRAYGAYLSKLALWQANPGRATAAATFAESDPSSAPLLRTAPVAEAAPISENWRIQIGAFTGRAAAEAAWATARERAPGLARYAPHYEKVPDRPELIRVQLGEANDRDGALRLCAAAAAGGFDCIPVPK